MSIIRNIAASSMLSVGSTTFLCLPSTVSAQPVNCTKVFECAQDAAKRAEDAVAHIKSLLANASTRIVYGDPINCTRPWEDNAVSVAACRDDEELLGGGCDMTCLGMRHLASIPAVTSGHTSPNAWTCHHAPLQTDPWVIADKTGGPNGQPRTFNAEALCRKKISP